MKLNDTDLDILNIKVVSFSPTTLDIENNLILPENNYNVILGKQLLGPQRRNLILHFTQEDDISTITSLVKGYFTLDLDDGYIYKCWAQKQPFISEEAYQYYTYNLDVYCLKQQSMITKTDVLDFVVYGNIYAEAIVKLTSAALVSSLTFNDMTITDLAAGDTLVIDGIDKVVYYESDPDTSVFDSVDMIDFPKLEPGLNNMTISDETVSFTVSYYPTFM